VSGARLEVAAWEKGGGERARESRPQYNILKVGGHCVRPITRMSDQNG
jgi:hypothetical protein